ncbi:MAG: branched-chain amino acid aminotransferase, partial [Desulfobulbia bacterium]
VTIDEVIAASLDGSLNESFATGTAAVISPIGELFYNNTAYSINKGETGALALKMFDDLHAIQHGTTDDLRKWTVRVG